MPVVPSMTALTVAKIHRAVRALKRFDEQRARIERAVPSRRFVRRRSFRSRMAIRQLWFGA